MLFAIIKDIISFFMAYLLKGSLLAAMVVTCYLCYELYWKKMRLSQTSSERTIQMNHIAGKTICIFLLTLYVYIVIGITILSRSESGTRQASFELLRTFQNTFFARKQIYENVIMFVPYAVLLFVLSKSFHRAWLMLVIGICSSLLIEVTQWVTKTGYFEVDDILTNTLGMLLGYIFCALIYRR